MVAARVPLLLVIDWMLLFGSWWAMSLVGRRDSGFEVMNSLFWGKKRLLVNVW
jgi:hypothetical protein